MSDVTVVKGARYGTVLVLVLALLGVALNSTGLLSADSTDAANIRYIAAFLPTLFYLAAIWMIQRAHAAITGGQAVETALATLLERMGICLFLGGLARVFGELWIVRLLLGVPTGVASFDVSAMTVGCVGLLLYALARPLRDAARARAELAEIL